MLTMRHEPNLLARWPVRAHDEFASETVYQIDRAPQFPGDGILAHDADQGAGTPQGRDVPGDIGCAARKALGAGNGKYGDGTLGRDALYLPGYEAIQHDIADAQDANLAEFIGNGHKVKKSR